MMHSHHPKPDGRDEFLVDGCPRCQQYADEMGIHFDPERFRAFWMKMYQVEYLDSGHWHSDLDQSLGRKLYYVALGIQRAFGTEVLPGVEELGLGHREASLGETEVERWLRREWWMNHGHAPPALYGDGGEMQCILCPADFKRQPLAELQDVVLKARMLRGVMCEANYCGALGWTFEKYGRITHKHDCLVRKDPWCQSHPNGCPQGAATG